MHQVQPRHKFAQDHVCFAPSLEVSGSLEMGEGKFVQCFEELANFIRETEKHDTSITGWNVFSVDNNALNTCYSLQVVPRRDDDGHNELNWYELTGTKSIY